MRFTFLLLLFLSVNSHAQKLEVLLVGASHNYGKSPNQEISNIYKKIRNFKPTAFFGEFLSKDDEQHLMDYWCKQDNLKRLEVLRKNRNINEKSLPKTIDSLKQLIDSNQENYKLKVDLAHAYYLNQDVSNAHYQYWQVWSKLQKAPDAALQKHVDELLSPNLDVSGRSMKRLKTSEYALIAFPLMQEMKIRELLPMDSQDYDLNWSASALAFHTKFELYKKDSTASHTNALRDVLKKREIGFKKYADADKNSKNLTEWLNTDGASVILSSGDFYFPELYELNNFPKEEMLSQLHWWQLRNQEMCKNVVNRARASKNKKIVVIVGANHRKIMQDIFSQMKDVTVKNINEAN